MTSNALSGRRLDALQGLRAIAAGLVVYAHALENFGSKVDNGGQYNAAITGFGVPIFFVISGFIITTSSAPLPQGGSSAVFFARRRVIRVVPIYWILTTLYAAKLAAEGASPGLAEYVKSLLFIPYANPAGDMRPVIGQGWTLNYEMFFYLVFAVLLVTPRMVAYAAMAAGFTALVVLRSTDVLTRSDLYVLWALAEPLLFYFLAGVALAVLGGRLGALTTVNLWTPIAGIAALLTGAQILASSGGFGDSIDTFERLPICVLAVAVCSLLNTHAGGRTAELVVAAGDGSYSTYLTHGFVMGPAASITAALGLGFFGPHIFAIGMCVVCTVVGWMVFRWVERPVSKSLNARWGGSRPSARPRRTAGAA